MSDHQNFCRGKTKLGKRCRAAATESGYCYFHANPNLPAELGRAGGQKNRHVVEGVSRPLPPIDTITGVKDALAQMIGEVHANRLDPKKAAGLAALLNALVRVLATGELEQKFKQMAK